MRLSIATKIFLGFTAVLASSGLVSVFGIVRMHRIGAGLQLVSSGYFPLIQAAGSLDALQKERTRQTEQLLDQRDPKARRNLVEGDRTYMAQTLLASLSRAREQVQVALRSKEGSEREALLRVDSKLTVLGERIANEESEAQAFEALLLSRVATSTEAPRSLPELRESMERLQTAQRRVDYEVKSLIQLIQAQANQGVGEAEQQERAARWALVGLSALALLVGLLVTWLAARVLSPISDLTEAAQALGRGAPEAVARIDVKGEDELSVLAREFNAMAERLSAREKQLRTQSEALVRSERLAAIGRIAAQITHEIRNPLSAIGLNAEELAARLHGEAEGEAEPHDRGAIALCEAIGREVDRLAAITEEYLSFARLPRAQLLGGDLSEAVRDLLDFVAPELDAAGVTVEAQLAPGLPQLAFDPGQIRQLLLNLVRNAREAMPGGGKLFVSTRLLGEALVVVVRDTGPGIAPERLQRIFDPFFTTKERGTGLGLALAQEVAQEHGGQLTCTSTQGVGTTFELRLPLGGR